MGMALNGGYVWKGFLINVKWVIVFCLLNFEENIKICLYIKAVKYRSDSFEYNANSMEFFKSLEISTRLFNLSGWIRPF